jgi:hypothetical protein
LFVSVVQRRGACSDGEADGETEAVARGFELTPALQCKNGHRLVRRPRNRPNPLKSQDFRTRWLRRPFFAAQRNTFYGAVLGIDGLSNSKKRNFLLKPL